MEVGCDICFQLFNEKQHKPRVLPCGHTLCHTCVQDTLIHTQLTCPFCRVNHRLTGPEDLPISFTLLNLATSLPYDSNIPKKIPQSSSFAYIMEPRVHDGMCVQHNSYKVFKCVTCNVWVCRDCTVVEHSPTKCTIMRAEEVLENMKQMQQVQTNNLKKECNDHLALLNSSHTKMGCLQQQQQSNIQDLHGLKMGPEACIRALKEEQKQVSRQLYEGQKVLSELEASLSELMGQNKLGTVTTGCQLVLMKRDTLQKWLLTSQQLQRDSRVTSQANQEQEKAELIQVMTQGQDHSLGPGVPLIIHIHKGLRETVTLQSLTSMLGRGKVWAVRGGGEGAGPITQQGGKIHLHALRRNATIPSGATVVPYECVRRLADQGKGGETTHTFLDLLWGRQVGGRVYITMAEEPGLGMAYVGRCSGEAARSYCNTRLHSIKNRGRDDHERVVGGTDDVNYPVTEIESGARRILTLGKDKVTLGTVQGAPVFILWHSSSPWIGSSNFVVMGKMIQGVEIVRQAAKQEPLTNVMVSDCGLMLTKE